MSTGVIAKRAAVRSLVREDLGADGVSKRRRIDVVPLRLASPATPTAPLPTFVDHDADDIAVLHTHEERFADLVRRHHHRFAHLAFMLCGDRNQAEDVVAEAYARVWPKFCKNRVDDPSAYVRRAIVNQIRGGFRRRLLERREEARQTVDQRVTMHPEASVDDRELLGPALLQLPVAQRAVIVLRFLEDLSEEQTAAVLGVQPGTVKSRCSRGLDQLRRLLSEANVDG
jgi:RNA polymerase sigma-70 factor (sigma-E family)